jgi:hypothetical protein
MYIRDFYRYIRIDFHSHYSNEYYCPISLLRVYGLTHLEQWKWDMWEEESRSKTRQDLKATSTMAHADVVLATEKLPEAKDEHVASQIAPSSPTPSGESSPEEQGESSLSPEHVEGSFRHSTDIARLEPLTSPTSSSEPSITATYLPPASPPLNSDQDSINDSHILSSNDTPTASSSVSLLSSRQANDPGTSASASRSSSPSTITIVSSPSMTQAFPSPPVTNLPPLPSPVNVHAGGESIYRTIMNRLNALEANTTLYARYVEEQTCAMREMLRRLSEDVGRLEGIGRAQAQLYERIINDFERHRREMDIEQRTLISQVNYLAEEVSVDPLRFNACPAHPLVVTGRPGETSRHSATVPLTCRARLPQRHPRFSRRIPRNAPPRRHHAWMGPTQLRAERRLGLPPTQRAAAATTSRQLEERTSTKHRVRTSTSTRRHTKHDTDNFPLQTSSALPHTNTPAPPRARATQRGPRASTHSNGHDNDDDNDDSARPLRRYVGYAHTHARPLASPSLKFARRWRRRRAVHRARTALRTALGALCAFA